MNAGVGHSTQYAFSLGVGDKEDLGNIPRSSLLLHTALEYTLYFKPTSLTLLRSQNSVAVLVWCSGRIATLTKLPVRVRFPSPTPQPQVLPADLLVSIKKLEKLSTGLGVTRGPFKLNEGTKSPTRLVINATSYDWSGFLRSCALCDTLNPNRVESFRRANTPSMVYIEKEV